MTPRLQQSPKHSLLAHPCMPACACVLVLSLLHRDIKLENLFISSRGHLQLGDFGLAISVLEERAISPVGTLEYMAPEILRLPSTGGYAGVLGYMRACRTAHVCWKQEQRSGNQAAAAGGDMQRVVQSAQR